MGLKVAFLTVLVFAFTAHASEEEIPSPADYVFDTTFEIRTPPYLVRQLNQWNFPVYPDNTDAAISLTTIVNIANQVWKVIKANEPVLNVKPIYANAIPDGARPETLEGFSDFQYRTFRRFGKNGFGIQVYDLVYTVVHRFGGSYQGHGRYLDSVSVIPTKVDVAWGYTLDLDVSRVSTVNVGTEDDPIASLGLELSMAISTVMKKSQYRQLFEFRGDRAQARVIQ